MNAKNVSNVDIFQKDLDELADAIADTHAAVQFDTTDIKRLVAIRRSVKAGYFNEGQPEECPCCGKMVLEGERH